MRPEAALTETTAASTGPAHGAYRNPSAAPTPSPDQNPRPCSRAEAREPRQRRLQPVAEPRDRDRQPEARQRDDRQVTHQRVAEPDAVDHRRQPDDRDRERVRQPEHDPERPAPPAGRARAQQRGQHRQHAGAERGTGAGEEGEEDEQDDASGLTQSPVSDERMLNLGACPYGGNLVRRRLPWCYIGKRRFEAALEAFEHRDEVTVMWRSFELDPEAPASAEGTATERLAAKYGMSLERAAAMHAEMTERAAAEGLEFHFELARRGNTFDAHRLIHLAATYGHQAAAQERLMRAYFTEGEAISDPRDARPARRRAGRRSRRGARVRSSSTASPTTCARTSSSPAQLGIQGVPFFVLDRRYGVSGAQPPEALLEALERAWGEAVSLST